MSGGPSPVCMPEVETVTLPAEGFVRLGTILKVLPISKTAWYLGIREGRFPKPVALGPNVSMWDVAELRVLLGRIARGELDALQGPPRRKPLRRVR